MISDDALFRAVSYIWAAFGGYWRAAAWNSKTPESRESKTYRYARWGVLLVTFWLIFSERAGVGFLGRRFVPTLHWIVYLGFILTLCGLALAIWARRHLSRYWSDMVGIQSGHQLICTGPYAYIRHPIYSGVLLAIAGTVVMLGEWRGLLAFVLQFSSWAVKAKKEEKLLAGHFGEQFAEHLQRTGFLLPRFRAIP